MLFSSFSNLIEQVRYYTPQFSVQNAVVSETAVKIVQMAQTSQMYSDSQCSQMRDGSLVPSLISGRLKGTNSTGISVECGLV